MAETDLEHIIGRHRAFWTREAGPLLNVSRYEPLSAVDIVLADGTPVKEDMYLTPEVLDPKWMVDLEEPRHRLQPDRPGAVSGDLLIIRPPLGKMCWVEAVMGCPVRVRAASGGIYSEPYLDGPEEVDRIPPARENGWLDLLVGYTRALVENANGRYYVTLPLMRGTIDLVAALLGYNKMAVSIIDQPRELRRLTERCVEAFLEVAKALYAVIPQVAGGRVTPFNVWAPGSAIKTQCDASAAVSARTYEEFFFPYEEKICSQYDYSMVHLHSGFLHTVDTFLKTEYPTAVQVSLDTGSTPFTPHDLIPVFNKVLERKPLFITGPCTQRELDEMLKALPSKGLCLNVRLSDAS